MSLTNGVGFSFSGPHRSLGQVGDRVPWHRHGTGSKECGWGGFTGEGPSEPGIVAQPSTSVAGGLEETPKSDFLSFSFADACPHSFRDH